MFRILIAILLFCSNQVISQNLSLISNSGNSYKSDKYIIDWSIGENIIETFSNDNYMLTQGLHQAKYNITSVFDNSYDQINMSCYPNPIIDKIFISISNNTTYGISDLSLNISSLSGLLLKNKNITNNITEIDLSRYPDGIYFINVRRNKKLIKSYKIIKTYK